MNNKIANKLYGALLRCGTPPETAASLARACEFLGESTEETAERDNYEIMITAKALSALVARHAGKATAENEPNADIPADATQENAVIKLSEPDDYIPEDGRSDSEKKSKFWRKLEEMPSGLRTVLANVLPIFMYFGMILLTTVVVALIAACLIAMIGMTVAGIALFIIGLLYGVSQLSVFPAAAYYEIGLGLVIGGVSALLIVLLYNVLTKLLPRLLKTGIGKLKSITRNFRKFKAEISEKVSKA